MEQVVQSKQDIMSYVQHMEELETREFTLRETAKEILQEKSRREGEITSRLYASERNIAEAEQLLKSAEECYLGQAEERDIERTKWHKQKKEKVQKFMGKFSTPMKTPDKVKDMLIQYNYVSQRMPLNPPQKKMPTKPKNYEKAHYCTEPSMFWYVFGIIVCIVLILGGIGVAITSGSGLSGLIQPQVLLMTGFLGAIICVIVRSYNLEVEKYSAYCEAITYKEKIEYLAETENLYMNLYLPMFYLCEALRLREVQHKQELALWEPSGSYLKERAEYLIKQADQIAEKKTEMYQLGIVPPDYQKMEWIIMINSFFRNDLADTMREAILLSREQTHRDLMERGIGEIYKMLGRLADSMSAIESCLSGIRSDVADMTAEMRGIASEMHESRRFQEKAADEARATRYAMESVQRSTELLEWYERKKIWQ